MKLEWLTEERILNLSLVISFGGICAILLLLVVAGS